MLCMEPGRYQTNFINMWKSGEPVNCTFTFFQFSFYVKYQNKTEIPVAEQHPLSFWKKPSMMA